MEDNFELDIDDDYDELCCKIYFTVKGLMIYHCAVTNCGKNFTNNERFLAHLQQFHNLEGIAINDDALSTSVEFEENTLKGSVSEETKEMNGVIEDYMSVVECSEGGAEKSSVISDEENDSLHETTIVNEAGSPLYVDCEESENVPPTDNDDNSASEAGFTNNDPETIEEIVSEDFEEKPLGGDRVNCKICQKAFISQDELETHIFARHYRKKRERKFENQKYQCPICNLEIKDRSNLSSHIRRHSESNKKYACNYCSKRFFSRTELRSHVRIHTGERPYLCSECGSSFASTGRLSSHITKNHTVRERKFKCDICGKAFFESFRLRNHKLLHGDERDHACSECGAAFKERKTLLQHMKIHENKRSYKCTYCDASFNQRPGLNSHLKIVHKTQ